MFRKINSLVIFLLMAMFGSMMVRPAMAQMVTEVRPTAITVVDVSLKPDFAPTIEDGKLVDRGHARYQKTTLDDLEINAAVNGGMAV